jgi:LAS superfamily LD-carboxypeptidase LdcB
MPSVPLRTVRGITVHADIAGALDAMLGAAAAGGVVLGGHGYRDPAAQVALRRAHCGPSTYAIYEMPASQCRPPTAIPGSSMHERGLAVDLTVNGSAITSRDSAAFRWLAANAARFGFYNLPSELWHWSVNGR